MDILKLFCLLACILTVPVNQSMADNPASYLTAVSPDRIIGKMSIDENIYGSSIVIAGQPFERGISVQADSEIIYPLTSSWHRLEAWAGLDMQSANPGQAQFQIYADDQLVLDSGNVSFYPWQPGSSNPNRPFRVSVPLNGCRQLRLIVKNTGSPADNVCANWANPRLVTRSEPEFRQPVLLNNPPLPPMGWNSWNCFGTDIDEIKIKAIIDTIIDSGLFQAGYRFINLDDGWQAPEYHDDQGRPLCHPIRFPNGIKSLADYAHTHDMKLGIYTRPAWIRNHYQPTAKTFAEWGIDYIKFDFSDEESNRQMIQATRSAGRPVLFAACEWGANLPWRWAPGFGAELWRTSYDVVDAWHNQRDNNRGIGILDAARQCEYVASICAGRGICDPDMLIVGLNGKSHHGGGCTLEEYRSQFTLWSLLGAPLLLGNDIRNLSPEIKAILTSQECIAVDQDRLSVPAWRVCIMPSFEIWKKPLTGGGWAIGILNLDNKPQSITIDWIKLHITQPYTIKDIWNARELPNTSQPLIVHLVPHQTALLELRPATDSSH